MLPDTTPLRVQPVDSRVYEKQYWSWIDQHVLVTSAERPRQPRIPRHFEFGLNHTHRIRQAYRQHWWRRWWAERSPWIDVLFFALVIAALVLAILWSGRQLEFGAA